MNGRKAKALRKQVYGDEAQRGQEKWGRIKHVIKSLAGGSMDTYSFVRMDKRQEYQQAKKRGR